MNSTVCANYAAQYLVATTLDGRVGTWRIAILDSGASVECVKVADVELKEALKAFDVSSGVSELKLHAHHDMLSASTKDGTVFFLDLTPLIRQAKPCVLCGIWSLSLAVVVNSRLTSWLTALLRQSKLAWDLASEQAPRRTRSPRAAQSVVHCPVDRIVELSGASCSA